MLIWCDDGVFPPSVDSMLLINAALKFRSLERLKKGLVADLGCGSGVIGIAFLFANPKLDCLFVDIDPVAYRCCRFNGEKNRVKSRSRFLLGNLPGILKKVKQPIKIAFCNPPYIPLPDGRSPQGKEISFAGLDMLADVVENEGSYYKRLMIVVSEAAFGIVEEGCTKAGATMKYILKREVTFSVEPVLQDKSWLQYLIGKGWVRSRTSVSSPRSRSYTHLLAVVDIRYW